MTWWEILLIVIGAVILVLFVGGTIGAARLRAAREHHLAHQLAAADRALAAARALDRGWERERLEEAARTAVERRAPGIVIAQMDLVQVVDRPGTEHDHARFRVTDAAGAHHDVMLARHGDAWAEA